MIFPSSENKALPGRGASVDVPTVQIGWSIQFSLGRCHAFCGFNQTTVASYRVRDLISKVTNKRPKRLSDMLSVQPNAQSERYQTIREHLFA